MPEQYDPGDPSGYVPGEDAPIVTASAHTPAPWRATKHTDTKGWTVSAGNSIASVRPGPCAEANARLIAAAPELFKQLDSIAYALECGETVTIEPGSFKAAALAAALAAAGVP